MSTMAEEGTNLVDISDNKLLSMPGSGRFAGDNVNKEKSYKLKFLHPFSPSTETQVTELKASLDAWREILLPLNAILHWEKQWHAVSIIGSSTMFFMLLWLLDPSVLTTASLIGLTLTVSDYLVPQLSASLLKTEPWTSKQEEQYDSICRSILMTKDKMSLTCRSFYLMRTTRPRIYYSISVLMLLLLAWIGNNVNNLFLTYTIVTFICLIPGMEHHGILQKYGCLITDKIADMATNARIAVPDVKKDD